MWDRVDMPKAHRTESIFVRNSANLSEFCHRAKNLYNNANYAIRQEFFSNGLRLRCDKLDPLMRNKEPEFNDYRTLPAHCSQQLLRRIDTVWTAFFKSIKDWSKNKGKYLGMPRLPKYLPKDGQTVLTFTNQQCSIRNGILKFPRVIKLEVKTRLPDSTDVREVRIVPRGTGHVVEIVYQIDIPDPKPKQNRIASIDLGLHNLVTFGDNIGNNPIIIKGGIAKSINQFYNKERARFRSVYDRQKIKTGGGLRRLDLKRFWKIKDHFHKVSRKIINLCVERNVDTLVIGHNNGWKQEANLGKRTNQNFVQIPYSLLINCLRYKGEENGIEVIVNEEAHTSKCSFLDLEPICHQDKYVGKRVSRGRFRSASGRVINADVNGMFNIMRKAIPGAFANGIEGLGMAPRRLSV